MLLIISLVMVGMYVRATFMLGDSKEDFTKSVVDSKSIIRQVDWMSEFSKLKDSIFGYPIQEVSLEFSSFNVSKTNEREYSILSLSFNIQKYDFECIKILFDSEKIIYSFLRNEFDVRFDLIVDNLTNKNAIKLKTNNCSMDKNDNSKTFFKTSKTPL